MSRLQHLEKTETAGCDNGPCGSNSQVVTGAIAPGWFRGDSDSHDHQLDACSTRCCTDINRRLSDALGGAPCTILWEAWDGRKITTSVGELATKGL